MGLNSCLYVYPMTSKYKRRKAKNQSLRLLEKELKLWWSNTNGIESSATEWA